MKSIILIAPPSAGKGTISKILCEEYHLPHISTGDLLRSSILNDDEQGNYIKQQMNLGNLVSDDIIISLVENRIMDNDCMNGYILDGFPRNLKQAKQYDEFIVKNNIMMGFVVLLDINREEAQKRILGRVSCPNCGAVFNLYSNDTRPRIAGLCDRCGSDLTRREDDNSEAFDIRFSTYLKETKPVVDYYESKGLLYKVNSSNPLSQVLEQVEKIIRREND
ncbi:MAG: nucleoside monophosphate kinase [Bacilli bacterium]|nr:nucleoside monophosphate kinase [Bacilli bacterium]